MVLEGLLHGRPETLKYSFDLAGAGAGHSFVPRLWAGRTLEADGRPAGGLRDADVVSRALDHMVGDAAGHVARQDVAEEADTLRHGTGGAGRDRIAAIVEADTVVAFNHADGPPHQVLAEMPPLF